MTFRLRMSTRAGRPSTVMNEHAWNPKEPNMLQVDVLYFEGCPNHLPVVELVRQIAADVGLDVEVIQTEVLGQAEAQRLRFLGSPTIQVNGIDVVPEARIRTDFSFSCRTYGGQGLPSRETLSAALLEGALEHGVTTQRVGTGAAFSAVLTALLASACCWLPLLAVSLGLSFGGLSVWFMKYRLPLLGVTAVLLATGFYMVYVGKRRCAPGSVCPAPNPGIRRFSQVMLWVATVAVIGAATFPSYVGYLLADPAPTREAGPSDAFRTVTLDLGGMTCEGCAALVQNSLAPLPDVQSASVSYADRRASVTIDRVSGLEEDSLVNAIEAAGYTARVATDPP